MRAKEGSGRHRPGLWYRSHCEKCGAATEARRVGHHYVLRYHFRPDGMTCSNHAVTGELTP